MNVDDKGHFISLLSEESFVGLRLRLRKGSLAWEVCGARIVLPVLVLAVGLVPAILLILDDIVDLAKINSEVAVQINTAIGKSADAGLSEVLAARDDLVLSGPVFLDRSNTIDVENRHIVELVLLEHLLVLWLFAHVTELDHLEHLVSSHRCADELASVGCTSQEDGRFLAAHHSGLSQRLMAELSGVNFLRLVFVITKHTLSRIHKQVIALDERAFTRGGIKVDLDYVHIATLNSFADHVHLCKLREVMLDTLQKIITVRKHQVEKVLIRLRRHEVLDVHRRISVCQNLLDGPVARERHITSRLGRLALRRSGFLRLDGLLYRACNHLFLESIDFRLSLIRLNILHLFSELLDAEESVVVIARAQLDAHGETGGQNHFHY